MEPSKGGMQRIGGIFNKMSLSPPTLEGLLVACSQVANEAQRCGVGLILCSLVWVMSKELW